MLISVAVFRAPFLAICSDSEDFYRYENCRSSLLGWAWRFQLHVKVNGLIKRLHMDDYISSMLRGARGVTLTE